MKCSKKLGFTLVETLMAIVIGVISVAALFYSYQFFNKSYQGILDKASISRSGREVLRMIARDLRNAGYKDVNYTRASWILTIGVKNKKYGKYGQADQLYIWYNTSPTDRIRIVYRVERNKKNIDEYYLSKEVTMNPQFGDAQIVSDNDLLVNHVTDFQVVLRDRDGKELVPVCFYCGSIEFAQGGKPLAMENMSRVHTAEVHLTLRSPNEIYKKERTVKIVNHVQPYGFEQTIKDRYHRETFFVSVHTRNLAKN